MSTPTAQHPPSSGGMADVGGKAVTTRTAEAEALVRLPPEALADIRGGEPYSPKGPVYPIARVAGIMAAKRTADTLPLCHPLILDHVAVSFELNDRTLRIRCAVRAREKTGVEMEALHGAAVAALTVYDLCKPLGHGIEIGPVRLLSKTGGRSDYRLA